MTCSLSALARLAADIQEMGAVTVTLTGGEPLLREDLEQIAGLFDQPCCLTLGTTGAGLTRQRAAGLHDRGLFAVGISLDSIHEEEHDHMRRRKGAFQIALGGLQAAAEAGLYPYLVSVATREFLHNDHFWPFMRFAGRAGALEVHLLRSTGPSPHPTGRRQWIATVTSRSSKHARFASVCLRLAAQFMWTSVHSKLTGP